MQTEKRVNKTALFELLIMEMWFIKIFKNFYSSRLLDTHQFLTTSPQDVIVEGEWSGTIRCGASRRPDLISQRLQYVVAHSPFSFSRAKCHTCDTSVLNDGFRESRLADARSLIENRVSSPSQTALRPFTRRSVSVQK